MANQRISDATRERITAAWAHILGEIAGGAAIKATIEAAGFSTGELRAYRASVANADAEWARAKEESADALADEIREEANNRTADPAFARVRIDALKWLASKRNPRTYSDKMQHDVTVKSVDLTRIISEANARLAGRAPRVLEHDAPKLLELLL